MNNPIFREFSGKLVSEFIANGESKLRSDAERLARETFSPAYELLEEARLQLLEVRRCIASPTWYTGGSYLREKVDGQIARITALLAGKENNLDSQSKCPRCEHEMRPEGSGFKCDNCGGQFSAESTSSPPQVKEECPRCLGAKKIKMKQQRDYDVYAMVTCPKCNGTGTILTQQERAE